MRAAAIAASHPAWPAPTTATSKCSVNGKVSDFNVSNGETHVQWADPQLKIRRFSSRSWQQLFANFAFGLLSPRSLIKSREEREAPQVVIARRGIFILATWPNA